MRTRAFDTDLPAASVTPPTVFFDRRSFLRVAAGAGLVLGPWACAQTPPSSSVASPGGPDPRIVPPRRWPEGFAVRETSFTVPEGLDPSVTPRLAAASSNNFYEFLPGRAGDLWAQTKSFDIEPWSLEVSGACNRPVTLSLDDLDGFEHEQRLYHFRCVERWAMNVPWVGFPLRVLLERVQPASNAKYVRFVTANRPEQMPGLRQSRDGFPWPYHEALRLDEALHDLTFVVTGVYGEPLPKQHGAPVRLIVPWKYGYKSPKSIVSIELLETQPPTFWSAAQPHEYGFLSNVNPNIPHPRWSQARSYWLHDREWFETPIFNGYDRYVRDLYPDEPREPQEPLRAGQIAR